MKNGCSSKIKAFFFFKKKPDLKSDDFKAGIEWEKTRIKHLIDYLVRENRGKQGWRELFLYLGNII